MTVAFTSGNVTAVGGTFIQSDAGENPLAGTFHVILSDGTDQSVTSLGSGTQPFTGFTTTSPTFITSMTVSSPGAGSFATLENLTVGAAVPEPQHYAMAAGLGLLAFGAFRRVRSGKLACPD